MVVLASRTKLPEEADPDNQLYEGTFDLVSC